MRLVEEIQADVLKAAKSLEDFLPTLGLDKLQEDLKEHYPKDADEREAIGTGKIPPTLAWSIDVSAGAARERLEDALDWLQKGASATDESVRTRWLQWRMRETSSLF